MIRKSESGQALVIGAFAMVALLAVAGLAIDMGVLRYDQRMQQTAADAAAIAGAVQLAHYGVGTSEVTPAALNASAANGFTNNVGTGSCPSAVTDLPTNLAAGSVQVTVCNGPLTGPHSVTSPSFPKALPADYVQVFVSAGQPTYFMKVLGIDSETVTASAVATNVTGGTANGAGCIYTLEGPQTTKITAAKDASLGTSGSVTLSAPSCGINDNGDFVANGGAQLSVTAASIDYGGTYNPPSSAATISPTPVQTRTAITDPLAGEYTITPGQSYGPIDIASGNCTGSGCSQVSESGGVFTIQPGTYDDICIHSGQIVNFSDGGSTDGGLFILTGASTCNANIEFEINSYATVCNSGTPCSGMPKSANNGVTFYLTGSASVNVSGTATVNLVAPNSGPYEGLLFYQSPTDTASASLLGNGTSSYQGALYFPSATLNFGGDATGFNSSALYTVIVVNQLQFYGNPDVTINADYSSLANNGGPLAAAISTAVLVQ
jgi:hypothetical protein